MFRVLFLWFLFFKQKPSFAALEAALGALESRLVEQRVAIGHRRRSEVAETAWKIDEKKTPTHTHTHTHKEKKLTNKEDGNEKKQEEEEEEEEETTGPKNKNRTGKKIKGTKDRITD